MKDDRDDSDNDDMEHDSGDSDKSSSTSDSSDASDSDDSSELDSEECERRRNECLDDLAELERQFTVIREQLYRERIAQVNTKLNEVHNGVAIEYRQPMEELQENMKIRIEVAGVLRKLRLENIENSYKAEEQAAKQNFENEKRLLFDQMKEELEEKIRRLEEDHTSERFHTDLMKSTKYSQNNKNSRSMWKRGHKVTDSKRKPVSVSGPYIVYMLKEDEILEDWTIIKKSLNKRSSETKSIFNSFRY